MDLEIENSIIFESIEPKEMSDDDQISDSIEDRSSEFLENEIPQIIESTETGNNQVDVDEMLEKFREILGEEYINLVQELDISFDCVYGSMSCDEVDVTDIFGIDQTKIVVIPEINENLEVSCQKKGRLSYNVQIIFNEREEYLNFMQLQEDRTIADKIKPRALSSRKLGYQVEIEFAALEDCHFNDLETLIDCFESVQPIPENINVAGIVYSISGKLPANFYVQSFELNPQDINQLNRFMDPNFYKALPSSPEVLRVFTIPIDLKKYFAPLFDKLIKLMDTFVHNLSVKHDEFQCTNIVRAIVEELLTNVKCTAYSIKRDENYTDSVTFLRNILGSFLLNDCQLRAFFSDLSTLLDKENFENKLRVKFNASDVSFMETWKISVLYEVTLSSKWAFNELQADIEKYLQTSSSSNNRHDDKVTTTTMTRIQFKNRFNRNLLRELECAIEKIKSLELGRESLEQNLLHKSINTAFRVKFSNLPLNTQVKVVLIKNGDEMRPSVPILARPYGVTKQKASHNKIDIKWQFKESEHVQNYRIEYYKVSDDTSKQWHSIITENNRKSASVENLAQGEYIFRVQACFGKLYGSYSEESESFRTEVSEGPLCRICWNDSTRVLLFPCGHTLCDSCRERIHSVCPLCRGPIENSINIYHS